MVAWAGAEHLVRNETSALDFAARARWPLDADATPVIGSGRLGHEGVILRGRLRLRASGATGLSPLTPIGRDTLPNPPAS